jgi:hypothetical protein
MIFTRVGCLLNGCCAGRPADGPIALYLPNVHGVWCRRLPTQILEAGLAAVLLTGSVALWNRLPFDGALFLANLAAYGIGRCGLELTRETSDRVGSVRLHQAISVGLVALAVAGFLYLGFQGAGTGRGERPVGAEWAQAPQLDGGVGRSAWSFLLAPPAVLAVLLLFHFVGCGFDPEGLGPPATIGPYESVVMGDNPVAYWRLQETDPTLPAKNEVMGSPPGTYIPAIIAKSPQSPGSGPLINISDTLKLGQSGLLQTDPSATAMQVQGGSVTAPFPAAFNPSGPFTIEALVFPQWDSGRMPGFFFTLLESLNKPQVIQTKPAGFGIYAGPDPKNPLLYQWQVWVATTGGKFEQLQVEVPAGDPGPSAEIPFGLSPNWSMYIALTYEPNPQPGRPNFILKFYNPDRDMNWNRSYNLSRPSTSYQPNNTDPLLIGIGSRFSTNQFPLWGKIEEVAIYNKVVQDSLLFGHGMNAYTG